MRSLLAQIILYSISLDSFSLFLLSQFTACYLDDGSLAGTLAVLTESMVIMNKGKCKLWSPCPSGIPSVSWASFVDYDSEITVLGCPFGSATSIETALEKKCIELGRLWEQLRTIPDRSL